MVTDRSFSPLNNIVTQGGSGGDALWTLLCSLSPFSCVSVDFTTLSRIFLRSSRFDIKHPSMQPRAPAAAIANLAYSYIAPMLAAPFLINLLILHDAKRVDP
jgi:hypothetical protein